MEEGGNARRAVGTGCDAYAHRLREAFELYRWAPREPRAIALDEAVTHAQAKTVPACRAASHLVEQFVELHGARAGTVHGGEPVPQHVRLPRAGERLQCLDPRFALHRRKILRGDF